MTKSKLFLELLNKEAEIFYELSKIDLEKNLLQKNIQSEVLREENINPFSLEKVKMIYTSISTRNLS